MALLESMESTRSIRWRKSGKKKETTTTLKKTKEISNELFNGSSQKKNDICFDSYSNTDDPESLTTVIVSRRRDFLEFFDTSLLLNFIHPVRSSQLSEALPPLALLLTLIEENMVVHDCSAKLFPNIPLHKPSRLTEALTLPASGTHLPPYSPYSPHLLSLPIDHDIDYQRLETMGDSVVKLLISMYLLSKFPHRNEGQLSVMKTQLINNQYLSHRAQAVDLQQYIITDHFKHRKFLPIGYRIKAKIRKQKDSEVTEGMLADVAEAVIGSISPLSMNKNFQYVSL